MAAAPHRGRAGLPLFLLALLAALGPLPLWAAGPEVAAGRDERPAAFDSSGRYQQVGPALRRQLGLFPEIPDFATARLWCGRDGTCALEIEYRLADGPVRRRQRLSPAGLDSLRAPFDRYLAVRPAGDGYDRSGRGELLFDSVILSLAVYGPASPVVLQLDGPRPSVAAYMLTSSLGYYLPYRLTRHRDVTEAHRRLTQYGATRGLIGGLVLKDLAMGGGDPHATARFAVGGSVAAAWAGFRTVSWQRYSEGEAETVGVMGDFGLAGGAGLAHVLDLYGSDRSLRAGDALVLAAAGTGLWLGERLGRRQTYTRGDAFVLRGGGIAGAMAALPLVNATGTSSSRAHTAGVLAGSAAGIAVTDRLLQPRDFTFGEGLMVSGGELAGALLGLGLTYLADTGGSFDDLVYLASAAVGTVGGFALTFRLYAPR